MARPTRSTQCWTTSPPHRGRQPSRYTLSRGSPEYSAFRQPRSPNSWSTIGFIATEPQFVNGYANRIARFLIGIGLPVLRGDIEGAAVLPGIRIDRGALIVDEARLDFPGDLLHEAGHLAVLTASERIAASADVGGDAGAEMAAIAWSYAAALYIDLDPAIVFHPAGYHGGSASILENFATGHYIGVPLLQWMGLTAGARSAELLNVAPYPHMLRWLRE